MSGLKKIESRQNIRYKEALKAQKSKDQIVLEGYHLCEAAFKAGWRLDSLWLSHSFSKMRPSEYQVCLQEANRQGVFCYEVSDALFNTLSIVPSPQGVLGILSFSSFVERQEQTDAPHCALLLDRIQDPGNLGTLLRSALAVGVKHIYLSKGCVNPLSSKVLRSAQGAHFHLNIHMDVDLETLIQKTSHSVYAAVLSQKARSLYEIDFESCFWLLLGNEGQGIDPGLLGHVDYHIMIPQTPDVESLNVGVAGSIILFEHYRQLLGT